MTTVSAASRPVSAGLRPVRFALGVDAAFSGLNGLVFLALSGPLSGTLGLSQELLLGLGAFFALYAAALAVVASRPRIPLPLVRLVAAGNGLWVLVSAAAAASGVVDPGTTAGEVWVIAQALLVLDFAVLQAWAVRRAA